MTQTLTPQKTNIQEKGAVVERLSDLLANTYALYLKTQNYHWNVTGPLFHSLHGMFEEQYKELAGAVDEIAERIRALDSVAPGSFAAFSGRSQIEEATGSTSADVMIQTLLEDHNRLSQTAHQVVQEAEKAGDVATADLATERIAVHQKTAWMLKSQGI